MASIVANYRDIFYYNQAGSPDPGFNCETSSYARCFLFSATYSS